MGRKKKGSSRREKEQVRDGLPSTGARLPEFRSPGEVSRVLWWALSIVLARKGAGGVGRTQSRTCELHTFCKGTSQELGCLETEEIWGRKAR